MFSLSSISLLLSTGYMNINTVLVRIVEHVVSTLVSSAVEPSGYSNLILTPLRKCGPHCLYCVAHLEVLERASGQGRELKQPWPYEERRVLSEDVEYSRGIWIFSRFHFSLCFLLTMHRMDPGLTVLVKQNLVTSVKGNLWQKNQGKLRLLTQAARK